MLRTVARRSFFLLVLSVIGITDVQPPDPIAQRLSDTRHSTPDIRIKAELTPERKAALDQVSANSLRGHLSFIASDLLEGRGTPSRGLDLAAEYIAAQFRRAGLEPGGDDGYFQTTTLKARGSEKLEKVRNVIGILRGSDPALKETY